MLKLTKRTEYGLIALLYLVDREGEVVSRREIGERYPIPPRVLAETLKALCRAGLVASQRGSTGGYRLALSADEIRLDQVVDALEGEPTLTNCHDRRNGAVGGTGESASVPDTIGPCDLLPLCPVRSPLERVRLGIRALLHGTTLKSLVESGSGPLPASPPVTPIPPLTATIAGTITGPGSPGDHRAERAS